MIGWTARAQGHVHSGEAPDRARAWTEAAAAAVSLCQVTAGHEAIAMAVGEETAELQPALDHSGELDLDATWLACAALLELIADEDLARTEVIED